MTTTRGVCVSYPYQAQVEGLFTESLVNLLIWDANHSRYITHHGAHLPARNASRLVAARNTIVRKFLDDPHAGAWLWCIDTDMAFRPDTLDRLLAFADPEKRPVVGGLCFAGGWAKPLYPTLFNFDQELPLADWPRDEPLQVDATGAACLLIHRSVLERMDTQNSPHTRYPWFQDGEHQGKEVGEDMVFCLRLKAMGIPVWVHTGIKIGHIKPWPITEELYDAMREELVG